MIPETIVIRTHDGPFHADDCFAVAVLKEVITRSGRDAVVIRSRDASIPAHFVVDVGGEYDPAAGKFDHHQNAGAGYREDGVYPYAAFGLVWKEFGAALCGNERTARVVDNHLVRFVDANDCGIGSGSGYSISSAIAAFNPSWKEVEQDFDAAFADACDFARGVLDKEIIRAKAARCALYKVRKYARKSEEAGFQSLLLLDRFVPWKGVVIQEYPGINYVLFPAVDGNWIVHAVPTEPGSFKSRKLLPTNWAGMTGHDFDKETGIEGGVFCHRNRFMAVHSSKEGAFALAELALSLA